MDKKIRFLLTGMIVMFSVLAVQSYASVDITGRWVGSTEVPDIGLDEFTLVFEKADGAYRGKMSDEFGAMEDVECEEIVLEDDSLTFHVEFFNGMDYITVYLSFTVSQDALEGTWEVDSGDVGEINFKRK